MPKGYWVGHLDVHDPDAYKLYVASNAVAFEKFGATFLVRGGESTQKEGHLRKRHVVLEFASYEQALACYESDEYGEALRLRLKKDVAEGDLVIVEGYAG